MPLLYTPLSVPPRSPRGPSRRPSRSAPIYTRGPPIQCVNREFCFRRRATPRGRTEDRFLDLPDAFRGSSLRSRRGPPSIDVKRSATRSSRGRHGSTGIHRCSSILSVITNQYVAIARNSAVTSIRRFQTSKRNQTTARVYRNDGMSASTTAFHMVRIHFVVGLSSLISSLTDT